MKFQFRRSLYFLSCLLGVFYIYPNIVMGQSDSIRLKTDSTFTHADSLAVYYFTASLDSLKDNKIHAIDTTLTYFHQYNPVLYKNGIFSHLGLIGHAASNRVFTAETNTRLQLNPGTFAPYLLIDNKIIYYRLLRPFTELGYVMGPNKEQDLNVSFSRGLSEQITIGLHLSIIHAPGAFQQQLADQNKSYFTGQYISKNKRYGLIATYFHNKISNQENGGLVTDSIFEQHLETDSKVIPVNLTTAENRMKVSGFTIEQYINLIKPKNIHKSRKRIDPGSITYSFNYLRSQSIYSDNELKSGFYDSFPVLHDSVSTFDSLYQIKISNRFQWSNLGYPSDTFNKVFYLYGGILFDYEKQHLPYESIDKSFQSSIPYGGLRLILFKRSILNARAEYSLGGYHSGDFKLAASLFQYLGSKEKNLGVLDLSMKVVNRMPSWYYSSFNSNRFRWNNNLSKQHLLLLQAEYQYKHLKAGVRLNTIQGYTFLNDSVKPVQLNTTGSILQLYTEGNLMIYHLGINFRLIHQSTSMPNSIHLPLFSGKLNLYYNNWVFRKAARLQTGFQLSYFTAYFSDAYMPELRLFHLQSEKKIGNYLFIDAYATLKVKSLRFFVKANNLLGYIGQAHYYDAPHYPGLAPGFFMGLIWRFHN